ncbi:MAG: hypothetical protein L0Z53_02735 [Acidobacteriales bacterium]|nr:hypothetical protein [Terriglobales bacterium]
MVEDFKDRFEIGQQTARRLLDCSETEFIKMVAEGLLKVSFTDSGRMVTNIRSLERATQEVRAR